MSEMGIGLGKAIVVLILVWLLVIVLMTGPLYHSSDSALEQIDEKLAKAREQVELLKRQNEEFRARLADLRLIGFESSAAGQAKPCQDTLYGQLQTELDRVKELLRKTEDESKKQRRWNKATSGSEPSQESEVLRRRVERGVKEMWFFMSAQLRKLREASKEEAVQRRIGEILEDAAEHKRSILVDVRNLSRADGRGDWAAREIQDLNELVQRRLYHLQNPVDCKAAKKAVCNLNKGCGYGCQLHHTVYCFILAYGMQRTLVLRSQGWRYNRQGWETVFQPVSETCRDEEAVPVPWPGTSDAPSVQLPIVDALHPRPDFLPLAMPRDLLERVAKVHGDPSVWWVSQFVKYLLRPQEQTANYLTKMESKMKFEKPIVGIHIRRTDKVGTEAAFHGLDEYMEHVDDYYRTLSLEKAVTTRRVYLASDDPTVLDEARKKYPDYVFLGDPSIAKSAAVSSRYSDDSLLGIIADIHLLSKCDYLVCTFSSQVCRVAYEIMQVLNVDASGDFYSLDDIYYFGGQSAHNQRIRWAHRPREGRGEIAVERGDIVGIAGNHWDGFSKGVNRRTNQEGLYPSFKAEEVVDAVDMPTYPEADKKKGA